MSWCAPRRMGLALTAFILTTSSHLSLSAQQQATIEVHSEIRVANEPLADIVEPHLSVSPVDSRHLVGAAMVIRHAWEQMDCAIVTSFDGGESWGRHDLGLTDCGDPWTLITDQGTALVSVLASPGGILVYRSDDGGRTWPDDPVVVPGPHDHEMMIGGTDGHPVYLVSGVSRRSDRRALRSAIFLAISDDDGLTFDDAHEVIVSNVSYEAMTPIVGSNGNVMIPLQDHHRSGGGRVAMRRSWLLEWDVEDRSFSVPNLVDEGCNRIGPVGWPTLAAVRSGPNEGRLIWACEADEAQGIRLSNSDDDGEVWATLALLGADGSMPTKIPTLATGEDGSTATAWFAPTPESDCLSLWTAISPDSSERFSPASRVGLGSSCSKEDDELFGRFPAGGDYIGLVWIGDGRYRILWSDARDDRFQLYSAEVGG